MDTGSLINLAARIASPTTWQTPMKRWPGQIAPTIHRDGYTRRPMPGYLGTKYDRTRLVFLGMNPGSGKGPSNSRPWDIDLFKIFLPAFVRSPNLETFSQFNGHLAEKLLEWPFFARSDFDFPRSFGLHIEEIAYSNVLPVNSTDELSDKRKAPDPGVFQYSVERFIGPWLDLLAPKLVVVLGKGAAGYLEQYWIARPADVPIISITHPSSPWKNRRPEEFQRELDAAKRAIAKAFHPAKQRQRRYGGRN